MEANPDFGSGYLYLAKVRLDLGDLAGAEEAARRGLTRNPDAEIAPLGHYVLADVYTRLGRPKDAAHEAAEGRRLEARRAELQRKIADLQDEARRHGVPPEWLR